MKRKETEAGKMKGKEEKIRKVRAEDVNIEKIKERNVKKEDVKIKKLKAEIQCADAVLIGAGAGLSTSAGFTYDGSRFKCYFPDFIEKYGFQDMYTAGFYPYETPEEHWAYWSRYIFINRYQNAPKNVYDDLFRLVQDKDYFVLTTNVDHCFQKSGFDKSRLFYTQGDYGLFQCSKPCHQNTYDNEAIIREMIEAQGYVLGGGDAPALPGGTPSLPKYGFPLPEGKPLKMTIPSGLVPRCPVCGAPMTMNLRADNAFVEDRGWHMAADRYQDFLRRQNRKKILYLELGVGGNTPGIIKYPFWQMTAGNPKAVYACINNGETACPREIRDRAICINGDIGEVLKN